MYKAILEKYLKGEKMFLEGKTLGEISESLKLDKNRFSRWLREEKGYQTRRSWNEGTKGVTYNAGVMYDDTKDKYEEGRILYERHGWTLKEIQAELKIDRKWFSKWLKEQGVPVRLKNSSRYTK